MLIKGTMLVTVWIALGIAIAIVLAAELFLRLYFGFGNPLIYVADDEIGYLLAPNQTTQRFGRQIAINGYSMRSHAIEPERSPDKLRLLLVGDSVANGGWWTDQTETISTLLQKSLQDHSNHSAFTHVEVLNASANSWGPRNELAYLKRFGTFNAQIVLLLINTDDLFATAPTSVQVGRDRNYPDRKPPLAIVELAARFRKPVVIPELRQIQQERGDRVGYNLSAIRAVQELVSAANGQFLLVLSPLRRELGEPGSRDYEVKARDRLEALTQVEQIAYLDLLPLFNEHSNPATLFQDHIHLNPVGNRTVSEAIASRVKAMLKSGL